MKISLEVRLGGVEGISCFGSVESKGKSDSIDLGQLLQEERESLWIESLFREIEAENSFKLCPG